MVDKENPGTEEDGMPAEEVERLKRELEEAFAEFGMEIALTPIE